MKNVKSRGKKIEINCSLELIELPGKRSRISHSSPTTWGVALVKRYPAMIGGCPTPQSCKNRPRCKDGCERAKPAGQTQSMVMLTPWLEDYEKAHTAYQFVAQQMADQIEG